jgi:putative transposase
VLEVLVQPRRDRAAALKLLRKLLKRQGFAPTVIVTDRLRSYSAALQLIGFSGRHEQGLRANINRRSSEGKFRKLMVDRSTGPLSFAKYSIIYIILI